MTAASTYDNVAREINTNKERRIRGIMRHTLGDETPRENPESGLMLQLLKKVPVTQNNPRCPVMPTGHIRNAMYATVNMRGASGMSSRRLESQGGARGKAFSSLSTGYGHRRNLTTADAAFKPRNNHIQCGADNIDEEGVYGTIESDKAATLHDEMKFNDELKETLHNLQTMPITKEKVWGKLLDLNEQNMTE